MGKNFFLSNAAAQDMLGSVGLSGAIDAGTAAVIEIYDGTPPVDADATESNTLLASLTCSATAFASITDPGGAGRATFDTITADSSADATGTATHFRIKTQTGGAVICQGTVGTTDSDLVLDSVAITAGATVSISAATIDLSEGS